MFLLYKLELSQDFSYFFKTDSGDKYSIKFSEYTLDDADGNIHTVYNFIFLCNGRFNIESFSKKNDPKIQNTLIKAVKDFFERKGHSALLYFCFNDDGYGRHRNIVFRRWCRQLPPTIEITNRIINYQAEIVYSTLLVSNDNPLMHLIVNAYENHIKELKDLGDNE